MKNKHVKLSSICKELGIDCGTHFKRIRESMFCRYMSGSSPENAVLDTGVTRMWLAALVEPDEVRPEIRKQFEGVTRQGRHELNEAWKISDVPEEIFHRMLRHGGGMTKKHLSNEYLLH
ncbi:MAG: hypothetical protein A2583_00840 [Bdellovibrionales bacterium RIFOXYD1_FULL_53_11]|nr:MAG: hypothetical protein A2583_00840 [Bdellovibrionales bacterium RIFOXYD1_FULL_53_11]